MSSDTEQGTTDPSADRKLSSRRWKFAILDCEDAEKWKGHEKIHIACLIDPKANEQWDHFKIFAGELPKDAAADYDGLVVTGSHYSITDTTLTWLAPFLEFLRAVVAAGRTRLLCTCFGHQAIAAALGGKVGRNPSAKFVLGAEEVLWDRLALLSRPWLAQLGHDLKQEIAKGVDKWPLRVIESHEQQVLELPPGAELLASSKTAQVEVWSLGNTVLSWQSHPELTVGMVNQHILPILLEKGVLTTAEGAETVRSFQEKLDDDKMLQLGRAFLRGPLQ